MTIDPNKYYNAQYISEHELFPWLKHPRPILLWLKEQVENGNRERFNIVVKPGNSIDSIKATNGDRYFIKGSGILKIQEEFENNILFK